MSGLSGHLQLRAEAREDGRTVLAGQATRSPYHVSKPYWDEAAGTLIVQVVNATAGILAGDRLESEIAVGPAAAPLAASRREASAVLPPTLQKMPSCAVGMAPSTTRKYWPRLAAMEACSASSACTPDPAMRVSW